jgi:hypothetical protein
MGAMTKATEWPGDMAWPPWERLTGANYRVDFMPCHARVRWLDHFPGHKKLKNVSLTLPVMLLIVHSSDTDS